MRRKTALITAVALTLAPALRPQSPSGQPAATIPPIKTPVTAADLRSVQRAAEILDSLKKWNTSDTEDCPAGAAAFTLYCALAKAAEEVSGKVADRSAATQEARVTIDLMSARRYGSPLTDFNHDPATTFNDVQEFFRILRNRLTLRMSEEAPPTTHGAPPEEWRSR